MCVVWIFLVASCSKWLDRSATALRLTGNCIRCVNVFSVHLYRCGRNKDPLGSCFTNGILPVEKGSAVQMAYSPTDWSAIFL
jgi:hypothetical protein